MISKPPPRLAAYAIAILLVGVAIALTFGYVHVFSQPIIGFFYLAVCASTWYGGRYPGLVTLGLSLVAIAYCFIPPFQTPDLSLPDGVRLGIYAVIMGLLNWLTAELVERRRQIEQISQRQIVQGQIRLGQALQAANMGAWEYDLQTDTLVWSPEHETLFGLAPGTFDGRYDTFEALVHPDDRVQVRQSGDDAIARKGHFTGIYRIIWPDGSLHWIESRGQVIGNGQGQVLRLSGTVMGIDERIQAEQALQELNQQLELRIEQRTAALQASEARYRAIVQDQTELIVRFRPDGTIVFVNDAYCRYFGLHREEMVGTSYVPNVFEADREWVNQQVQSISAEQPIITITNRVLINGELRWTQWITRLLSNSQGQASELQAVGRDITELKHSEVALRLSENRLKLALEASGDGLWEWNIATGEIYIDSNWLGMLGYADGELIPHVNTWASLIHPEDQPWVTERLNAHLQDNRVSYSFDYRIKTQAGAWKWIANYGKVVAWEVDGRPLRMVGTHQDISDRKQGEEQLRSLSDRLTLALKSGAIGTWDWDLVHDASWDERMYELYGFQNLGRPACYNDWLNAVHPADRQDAEAAFNAAVRGEREFDTEFRIFRPDGTLCYIKACALVQRNAQGDPVRMVGINYDITDRKQVEQALAQYTRDIEDLYDKAPCGYHSLDAEGRYIRVNETELMLLGYSREDMIGQSFLAFVTPSSHPVFLQNYPIFRQRGWVKDLEFDMVANDGTVVSVLLSATAVNDEQGNFLHSRSTIVDIRDRKQAEEQLRLSAERISLANAELSRAARLKDEFLAGMSHELRTPLNAILGMSEVLLEEIHGNLAPRQRDSVMLIERSGNHLLTLINDILDLAKVESGKMELEISTVSIATLCNTSLGFVRQQAHQKQIHLHCQIDPSISAVEVDERRIRQVLINLLSNAVKFTPEGGRVQLSVALNPERETLEFAVSDTGIGIAPNQISKLFQPFVQLDSSLSRRYSGTGLGLALVRRIVELHGGSVVVESEVGQGSCFTVLLPQQPYHPLPVNLNLARPPLPSSPLPIHQVLIVEDSEAAASQVSRYLTELGATTMVHPLGRGVVELALQIKPDLIVLDILLPDLPGWTVLIDLKAHPVTCAIPVLVISVVDERARGLELGAADYLLKPITRTELHQAITRLMGGPEDASARLDAVAASSTVPLIVLAEDNETNIEVMLNYLHAYGFRTAIARNGIEAVQLVRQLLPDLVLMDIQMPEMDGLEAIRQIRAEAPLATLPIIALTALAMPGDREHCLTAGANEYLTKPVSLKQLMRWINHYLPQE